MPSYRLVEGSLPRRAGAEDVASSEEAMEEAMGELVKSVKRKP